MAVRDRWRVRRKSRAMRHCLYAAGWFLMLLSPVVGVLPGPGGLFLFAAGVALLFETSPRARRTYVRVKRRWPRLGGWVDRGLRRPTERRRRMRAARVPPVIPG